MNDTLVICDRCGKQIEVSFGHCLRNGWPICHGVTMRMDSTTAMIEDEITKRVAESITKAKIA